MTCACEGKVRCLLDEDLPGYHVFAWACDKCHTEFANWIEHHHGISAMTAEAASTLCPKLWKKIKMTLRFFSFSEPTPITTNHNSSMMEFFVC